MQRAADLPDELLALRADVQLVPFTSRVADQEWLVICDGRHYAASARLAELFELVRAHPALALLRAELNHRWHTNLTQEQTRSLVERHLGPFLVRGAPPAAPIGQPRRATRADFLCAFPVVSERVVATLARRLCALYAPALAVPLSLLVAVLLADAGRRVTFEARLDPAQLGWGLALSIAITLIHELGHASAYMRWFRRSGPIYFALLLVLPVMFVRVDDSWRGGPRARLGVDLGGVYFQWLAFIPLCCAGYLDGYPRPLFEAGLWINGLLLACNLNPLLKFDGYWVLSSLLGVPNLAQSAARLLADRVRRRPTTLRVPKAIERALLGYAGLRWAFVVSSLALLVFHLPQIIGYAAAWARTCARGVEQLSQLGWSIETLVITAMSAFKVGAIGVLLGLLVRLGVRATRAVLLRTLAPRGQP